MKERSAATPSPLYLTNQSNDFQFGSIVDYDVHYDYCDLRSPYAYEDEEKYNEFNSEKEIDMEEFRSQNEMCAEKALEFYNKKYRTNYELVDALPSNGFIYDAFRFHCNFKAKLKTSPSGDGNSPTKLFFAELYYPVGGSSSLNVAGCCILKGNCKNNSCDLYDEPDDDGNFIIKHPAHGYHMRHYYKPYALRSRKGCG